MDYNNLKIGLTSNYSGVSPHLHQYINSNYFIKEKSQVYILYDLIKHIVNL